LAVLQAASTAAAAAATASGKTTAATAAVVLVFFGCMAGRSWLAVIDRRRNAVIWCWGFDWPPVLLAAFRVFLRKLATKTAFVISTSTPVGGHLACLAG
jgi:hypothetical protein